MKHFKTLLLLLFLLNCVNPSAQANWLDQYCNKSTLVGYAFGLVASVGWFATWIQKNSLEQKLRKERYNTQIEMTKSNALEKKLILNNALMVILKADWNKGQIINNTSHQSQHKPFNQSEDDLNVIFLQKESLVLQNEMLLTRLVDVTDQRNKLQARNKELIKFLEEVKPYLQNYAQKIQQKADPLQAHARCPRKIPQKTTQPNSKTA